MGAYGNNTRVHYWDLDGMAWVGVEDWRIGGLKD